MPDELPLSSPDRRRQADRVVLRGACARARRAADVRGGAAGRVGRPCGLGQPSAVGLARVRVARVAQRRAARRFYDSSVILLLSNGRAGPACSMTRVHQYCLPARSGLYIHTTYKQLVAMWYVYVHVHVHVCMYVCSGLHAPRVSNPTHACAALSTSRPTVIQQACQGCKSSRRP